MKELFEPASVAQDSPRLRWMKAHRLVVTLDSGPHNTGTRWCCHRCGDDEPDVAGLTELDAIANWARRNNMKLWNEE